MPQPPTLQPLEDHLLPRSPGEAGPSTRTILRIVFTVLVIVGLLVLIRLLWQPIAWLILAMFLAIALSGPVNILHRRMRRGLAIAIVYTTVLLVPIAIAALIVPPIVRQGVEFANKLPQYADNLQKQIDKNPKLSKINKDFGVTDKVNTLANDLPNRFGAAAGTLRDLGATIVSSLFAGVSIFVLSIFMVARGRRWIDMAIDFRGGPQAENLKRAVDRIANAVGNYVGGAIVQATVAGLSSFIVLTILGVPFAGALALLVALFDLLPMVGATIAAVLVGVVTVFTAFPTNTIIWAIFAVAYQQFENYVIQPQIQKRAVELEPFVVLVAVLFGGALFGVIGALLAIPAAATIQISAQEWWRYRLESRLKIIESGRPAGPTDEPPAGGPAPAVT